MAKRITKADRRALKAFLRGAYAFLRQSQHLHFAAIPDEQHVFKWKGKLRRRRRCIVGECIDAKIIRLDWRANLVNVLIHELLHALHWDWTEKEVAAETSRLMRVLTPLQALHLMRWFVLPKQADGKLAQ